MHLTKPMKTAFYLALMLMVVCLPSVVKIQRSRAGAIQALPNLTPYQPSGWSDKIVVSTTTGATVDNLHYKEY